MSILKNLIKSLAPERTANTAEVNAPAEGRLTANYREGAQIICFAGPSQGNALSELTLEMMRPFAKASTGIHLIDISTHGWTEQLNALLAKPVWFAASYFGVGQQITTPTDSGPKNLWEISKIPFLRLYGDTPAYFPDRHMRTSKNSINAYGDISHASFYRRWFKDPALSIVTPPILINKTEVKEIDYSRKRNGKIIFPKNGNSPTQLIDYWRARIPQHISEILENISESITARDRIDSRLSLDEFIISEFQKISIDISSEPAIVCFMTAQLDDYLRRFKSTLIIESIQDLPIVLLGKNWDHVSRNTSRLIHESNDNYSRTKNMMAEALAVLDMAANFHHGPHDRVLRAAGQGTAFLTNTQAYFDEILPNSSECTFKFNKDSIHDTVESALTNPERTIQLGIENSEILRSHHTDEKYAEIVTTAIQTVAFKMGNRPEGTQNYVDFPPRDFS